MLPAASSVRIAPLTASFGQPNGGAAKRFWSSAPFVPPALIAASTSLQTALVVGSPWWPMASSASGAPSRALVTTLPQLALSPSPNFGKSRMSERLAAVSTASRSVDVVSSAPPPWKTRALRDDVLEQGLQPLLVASRSVSSWPAVRPCPRRSAASAVAERVLGGGVAGEGLLDLVDLVLGEEARTRSGSRRRLRRPPSSRPTR